MSQAQIAIALAGVSLALASYIVTQYRQSVRDAKGIENRLTKLESSIGDARDIEHRITTIETKVGVFWKIIEEGAVGLLHRDDTPEIDMLLEKLCRREELSAGERRELIKHLKEIERDEARTRGEQSVALLLRAAFTAKHYEPKSEQKP